MMEPIAADGVRGREHPGLLTSQLQGRDRQQQKQTFTRTFKPTIAEYNIQPPFFVTVMIELKI